MNIVRRIVQAFQQVTKHMPYALGIIAVQIIYTGALMLVGGYYMASGIEALNANPLDGDLIFLESRIVVGQGLIGWGIIAFVERLMRIPGELRDRHETIQEKALLREINQKLTQITQEQAQLKIQVDDLKDTLN